MLTFPIDLTDGSPALITLDEAAKIDLLHRCGCANGTPGAFRRWRTIEQFIRDEDVEDLLLCNVEPLLRRTEFPEREKIPPLEMEFDVAVGWGRSGAPTPRVTVVYTITFSTKPDEDGFIPGWVINILDTYPGSRP